MTKRFFELRGSHNPHRWNLPLNPSICVGPPDMLFMYGGVGLAAVELGRRMGATVIAALLRRITASLRAAAGWRLLG